MTERVFVDTNVLVYARDLRTPDKRARARAWLAELDARADPRINLQVLNELTRWLLAQKGHSAEAARAELEAFAIWGDQPIGPDEVEIAWIVRERLGYQWFDCLLLASAHLQGCRAFLSEDMTHGATFEGLTLVNPFRLSPDEFFQRN